MRISESNIPPFLSESIKVDLLSLASGGSNVVCVGINLNLSQESLNQISLTDTVHLMHNTTTQQVDQLIGHGIKNFGIWSHTPSDVVATLPKEASVYLFGGKMSRAFLNQIQASTIHISIYTDESTLPEIPVNAFICLVGNDDQPDRYVQLFANQERDAFNFIVTDTTPPAALEVLSKDARSVFHLSRSSQVKHINCINTNKAFGHGKVQVSYDTPTEVLRALQDQHLISVDYEEVSSPRGRANWTRKMSPLMGKNFVYDSRLEERQWRILEPKFLVIDGAVNADQLMTELKTVYVYQNNIPGFSDSQIVTTDSTYPDITILPVGVTDAKTLRCMPKVMVNEDVVTTRSLRTLHRLQNTKIFINDSRVAQYMGDKDEMYPSLNRYFAVKYPDEEAVFDLDGDFSAVSSARLFSQTRSTAALDITENSSDCAESPRKRSRTPSTF
jgi:hypothetical protein